MNKKKVILAIETAFAGGSVSLFEKGLEIDRWIGSNAVSKSEDVLDEISFLLNKNKIRLEEIKTIIVSRNAGSLTGQRIGQALARGLAKSLDCEYREVSVLKSLLIERTDKGKVLTLIQTDRREFWYQIFYVDAEGIIEKLDSAEKCEAAELDRVLNETNFDNLILHQTLGVELFESEILDKYFLTEQSKNYIKTNGSSSKFIGLFVNEN